MKFKLTIELGNDAMRSGEDIAVALQKIGEQIEPTLHEELSGRWGNIRDVNGNLVGKWKVTR